MSGIFVLDDLHPEDNAMLQALYSRSPASVNVHLPKVRGADSGAFMDKFYVGYGHASIGDCGSTTIFIEDVSMLVAKAIQDNPLYSGQESSTRYLDFSAQPLIDPYGQSESRAILDRWMAIYNRFLPLVKESLSRQYPFDETAYPSRKVWENAIAARAFDVSRGLLPVGVGTNVSWHTNLRQAREKLMALSHHPLAEVREVAMQVFAALREKYPHSFREDDMTGAPRHVLRRAFADTFAMKDSFLTPDDVTDELTAREFARLESGEVIVHDRLFDVSGLNRREEGLLSSRPQGAPLSRRLQAYGVYNIYFMLDFGSFRDIQRHRNGLCRMPLVDGRFGMHRWYLDDLESKLSPLDFAALKGAIDEQFEAIAALDQGTPTQNQYLYPLGTAVLCHMTYSLPEMVYVAELRSGKTVHPSLRLIAWGMLDAMTDRHPKLALYGDRDLDSWTARRGTQTIDVRNGK
ncbi:MAG: hypothetical protein A2018_00670 [Alphaproteobacteria bacterium GWF2_58_20]|nr:MAG: hypothetical protein A2018_00670 [Alphaproteobacteria bacterium GWF2_58_20]